MSMLEILHSIKADLLLLLLAGGNRFLPFLSKLKAFGSNTSLPTPKPLQLCVCYPDHGWKTLHVSKIGNYSATALLNLHRPSVKRVKLGCVDGAGGSGGGWTPPHPPGLGLPHYCILVIIGWFKNICGCCLIPLNISIIPQWDKSATDPRVLSRCCQLGRLGATIPHWNILSWKVERMGYNSLQEQCLPKAESSGLAQNATASNLWSKVSESTAKTIF